MKVIIPMAGMGKRMRPHTLTTPKPLLAVAGKPIVETLINDIARMLGGHIDEVAFIIGDFGKEVEKNLLDVARKLGYPAKIYYQMEALGTAHALACADPSLEGNVLVAYADTLFHTDFVIDPEQDGYIWTKEIVDPSQFGVVVTDEDDYITAFVEKPKEPVSNLAIIGIYYFKKGEQLRDEIHYLLDNNITGNGEYQLTDALENLKAKSVRFKVARVDGWFDCGNKDAMVETNEKILKLSEKENRVDSSAVVENSKIIQPCFIGRNVRITDSTVGPYVSVSDGTVIEQSRLESSIVYAGSTLKNCKISHSMIGSFTHIENIKSKDLSLGDYSQLKGQS